MAYMYIKTLVLNEFLSVYTKHVYVEMWRGKGVGKTHLADSME